MGVDPVMVMLGLVVGALIGLTGVGGGSVMTPALVLLGVPPLTAVGTDLLYASVTRLIGVGIYGFRGKVRFDIVSRLVAGSLPAVLVGGIVLRSVPEDLLQDALTLLLGLALLATSALSLLDREISLPLRPRKRHALLAGFIVGLMVQFTSVGAGVIVGFALLHIARIDPREVVGTTLLYGLILGAMSLANYVSLGLVDYGLAAQLIAGTVPGVAAGAALSSRADPRRLKRAINLALLVIGVLILASGYRGL